MASQRVEWVGWPVVVHSERATMADIATVLAAGLFRLPETYWAPMTTLAIAQSSQAAAITVSWQRFVATALGAIAGAMLAIHFGPH